jgi:hypothetical protein
MSAWELRKMITSAEQIISLELMHTAAAVAAAINSRECVFWLYIQTFRETGSLARSFSWQSDSACAKMPLGIHLDRALG